MEIFVLGDLNCELLEGFATHLEPYSACNFTNQGYASIVVFNRFYFSFVKETRVVECHGQEDGIAYGTWGLSKSFDSIDNAKRLAKLSSLGVSSSALGWFKSYMHDRQQYGQTGS